MLALGFKGKKQVYLISRKYEIYLCNIKMPWFGDVMHDGTLLDGELVVETKLKNTPLRYLVYDLLIYRNQFR